MNDQVLTDDEVETLLEDAGAETGQPLIAREAVSFDFEEQYDLLLAKLPKLKKVTETVVRNLHESLADFIGREVEISIPYIHTRRFGDYMGDAESTTQFCVIEIAPQKVKGLVRIDPQLLYVLVDQYFGGSGRLTGLDHEKALSVTERKLSIQILEVVLKELDKAWKHVSTFNFTFQQTVDVTGANQLMGTTDLALLMAIQISMGETTGMYQIVIPYAWLETIRPLLVSEKQSEAVQNIQWKNAFARELGVVDVQVSCSINGPSMTLSEILKLKAGDVVPILRPSQVILNVEDLPVFEGTLGTSQGKNAVKISQLLDNAEAR